MSTPTDRRYFEEELRSLRDVGVEFSKDHPDIAHWLSQPGSDPAVERLLEGTAFLTSRVRQKVDEMLPALAQSLCAMVAPQLLEPVPAISLLRFFPNRAGLRHPVVVPRGAEVASVEVEGTSCRFQTTSAVEVLPVEIAQVDVRRRKPGTSELALTLQTTGGATFGELGMTRLRLHILGDWSRACTIYGALVREVERVRLAWGQTERHSKAWMDPASIVPAGLFAAPGAAGVCADPNEEALLPGRPTDCDPFRFLAEYDVFSRKYLAVEVSFAGFGSAFGSATSMELEFHLRNALTGGSEPDLDSFGLFCTPIVNLFSAQADPIVVRHEKAAYTVRPAGFSPGHATVHAVSSVTGQVVGTSERFDVAPLSTAAPLDIAGLGETSWARANAEADRSASRMYALERRLSKEGSEVTMSFTLPNRSAEEGEDDNGEGLAFSPEVISPEVISIDLQCTNGQLPRRLDAGDICVATGSTPALVDFINVTAPTPQIEPPIGEALYWKLLSQLHLNHGMWSSLGEVRELLTLRAWMSRVDAQAASLHAGRLEAMESWTLHRHDHMVDGLPIRCTRFEAVIDAAPFGGDGGLVLFGALLHRTLLEQAPLNTTCCLKISAKKSGAVHTFAVGKAGLPCVR